MNGEQALLTVGNPTDRPIRREKRAQETELAQYLLAGEWTSEHIRLEHKPSKRRFELVQFLAAPGSQGQHSHRIHRPVDISYEALDWMVQQRMMQDTSHL